MYKINKLEINGKKYPYIIDLNVLEAIQDEYGTIQEFERKILGLQIEHDANGNTLYDSEENVRYKKVEPSIKAIGFVLPEMINEGIAVEAMRAHKEYEPVEPLELMAEINVDYHELAVIIHDEFVRRFESKKSKPTGSRQRKKSQ